MILIEQIAEAALSGESLKTRSLVQEFFQDQPELQTIPQPNLTDTKILATSASLLELFADRLNQDAPAWTAKIPALPESVYLVKAASIMKWLKTLCETETPQPLRKRHIYTPPNYLEFVCSFHSFLTSKLGVGLLRELHSVML